MTDTLALHPVRRALISVSDKSGLIDLAKALTGRGIELLSTGGSAKMLRCTAVCWRCAPMPRMSRR